MAGLLAQGRGALIQLGIEPGIEPDAVKCQGADNWLLLAWKTVSDAH
jgi:hypothetical protein